MLDLLCRLWRWLIGPADGPPYCEPSCPRRGPGGEMCDECLRQWAIK